MFRAAMSGGGDLCEMLWQQDGPIDRAILLRYLGMLKLHTGPCFSQQQHDPTGTGSCCCHSLLGWERPDAFLSLAG
jgi:hypothetical protein